MLFLIDLDGTLIDTDDLHYDAWAKVLKTTRERVKEIPDMHAFLHGIEDAEYIRICKRREMLRTTHVSCIPNAEAFIAFMVEHDVPHVVVTNTEREVVEHFKTCVPALRLLKNWIVREDYARPKPHPECYQLAVRTYGQNETCIVGFENSAHGLEALRHVTGSIFFINNSTNYLKVIEQIKLQCPKRFGTPPTRLSRTEKKR